MRRTKARDGGNSPLDRLDQMTQRRSSPRKSPQKIPESADPEAILDIIDQRIGRLLVRSGDIESKIERLESEALPTLRDDPSSPRGRRAAAPHPRSKGPADADVSRLVRAVLAMHSAVQEIREEQRRTSEQLNEIHHRLHRRAAEN
jgi:hypothetical protein